MRVTARPPGLRILILSLVARFELTWERAATNGVEVGTGDSAITDAAVRRNLFSGRLFLCRVDCSECSDRGRADLAAGPRTMNAPDYILEGETLLVLGKHIVVRGE
jgi:hypothetical protein